MKHQSEGRTYGHTPLKQRRVYINHAYYRPQGSCSSVVIYPGVEGGQHILYKWDMYPESR